MKRISFFSAFIFFLSAIANAQEIFTLEQCRDKALENNIQIKVSENSVEISRLNLKQSTLDLFPTLNSNISESRNYGRSLDETTYGFTNQSTDNINMGVSSSVTLFNGFSKLNTQKQNRLSYDASTFAVEKTKNDVMLNVALQYVQILLDKELFAAAQKRVELSQKQLERTEKLLSAESITQGDLLNIQAQLETDKLNLLNAESQLEKDKLTLLQLMEMDVSMNFDIAEVPIENLDTLRFSANLESLYSSALQNMPEILQQQKKVQASIIGLKIARANFYPSLTFTTGINTRSSFYEPYTSPFPPYEEISPDDFWKQTDKNRYEFLTLTLRVPIFNGLNARNTTANARIEQLNQELELKNQENMMRKKIQQAYLDAKNAQQKYLATQNSLKSLEEAYNYAQKKFENGVLNSVDFLTAQNNYEKAKSDFLTAKYDFIFKIKVLDFYQGKGMKF